MTKLVPMASVESIAKARPIYLSATIFKFLDRTAAETNVNLLAQMIIPGEAMRLSTSTWRVESLAMVGFEMEATKTGKDDFVLSPAIREKTSRPDRSAVAPVLSPQLSSQRWVSLRNQTPSNVSPSRSGPSERKYEVRGQRVAVDILQW